MRDNVYLLRFDHPNAAEFIYAGGTVQGAVIKVTAIPDNQSDDQVEALLLRHAAGLVRAGRSSVEFRYLKTGKGLI